MKEMENRFKFRAFIDDHNGTYMDYEVYLSPEWTYLDVEAGWDIQWEKKDAIIMQYTGLKDKNWVGIYEGDILKWSWGFLWEVVYDNDFLQFRFNNDREIDYYWLDNLEIIGNKYENPELINNQ